jgi:diguanylate cyclase (GGDEF)-like protein
MQNVLIIGGVFFIAILFAVVVIQYRRIVELKQEMGIDHLTGLLNRREFQMVFQSLNDLVPVSFDKRRGSRLTSLAAFFIDIDHFKQINDTYGHAMGDKVLERVAFLIRHALREGDLVCRWGGEELVAVLPNVCLPEVEVVAEKIRRSIAEHPVPDGPEVTVSIGVACTRQHVPAETLIDMADQAMYKAKQAGRNQAFIQQYFSEE